jgi:hypothetical protein
MSDLYGAPGVKGRAIDISGGNHSVSCRALYVGGAGNVTGILLEDTAAVTFAAVPAGTVLPASFLQVNQSLTTASLMVALY